MKIFVETDRLILREILSSDDQGMFELDSDPEVHKYVGQNPAKSIEECRKTIEYVREQYISNGIGRWAVVEKASNNFIGWSGLKILTETVNKHTNFYDLGYRFSKKYWGKGFATESAQASLEYGIEKLKLKEIFAMTDPQNLASRKVLEKIGMKYIETFEYDGKPSWRKEGELATWYKIIIPTL